MFKQEVKSAKAQFYKKTVADLKKKSPGQWYSALKRITSSDQRSDQLNIEEISHLTDQERAEIIAEKCSSIQNEYQPLKNEDISAHADGGPRSRVCARETLRSDWNPHIYVT